MGQAAGHKHAAPHFQPDSAPVGYWGLMEHNSNLFCGLGHERVFLGSSSAVISASVFLGCLTEGELALSFQNTRVALS